jgi:hypothetical protein
MWDGVNGGKGVRHAAENLKALAGLQILEGVVWKNDAVDELHDKKRCAYDARRGAGCKDARYRGQVALQRTHYGGLAQNAMS